MKCRRGMIGKSGEYPQHPFCTGIYLREYQQTYDVFYGDANGWVLLKLSFQEWSHVRLTSNKKLNMTSNEQCKGTENDSCLDLYIFYFPSQWHNDRNASQFNELKKVVFNVQKVQWCEVWVKTFINLKLVLILLLCKIIRF